MKVYVKQCRCEDALRIELHISYMPRNRVCKIDDRYAAHVRQLVKEGLVEIR